MIVCLISIAESAVCSVENVIDCNQPDPEDGVASGVQGNWLCGQLTFMPWMV